MQTDPRSAATGALDGDERAVLETFLHRHIPLSHAMDVRVIGLDHLGLRLEAPLAPNVNDKGTAFGGALSALLMLAGWGWTWLETRRLGLSCDIVIRKGDLRFKRPVSGPLQAVCPPPEPAEWRRFERDLRAGERARLALAPRIVDERDRQAVRFRCQFVAMVKAS